jgi:NAD+ synthase
MIAPEDNTLIPHDSVSAAFPGPIGAEFDARALHAVPFARAADDALVGSLAAFLETGLDRLAPIGYCGFLIGLSGGLDSVVAVRLAQLTGRPTVAVTIDLGRPGEAERVERLRTCAAGLGVDHVVIEAHGPRAALTLQGVDAPWLEINLDTRLIQLLLAREADLRDAVVLCTTDRSEKILGRYTECFYGPLAPLADLYKTEVRAVAAHLKILDALTEQRPGCEDYWFDDDVLGADYAIVDPVLHLLTTEQQTPRAIMERFGFSNSAWLERMAFRIQSQQGRVNEQSPERPLAAFGLRSHPW